MTQDFKRASVTKMLIAEAGRITQALEKGEGQYETQTYLSPTGRVVAKVLLAGTAVEKEDLGKDESIWRIRVVDPTGSIMVMAGKFQPEAAQILAGLEIPSFVMVKGKLNVYEPEPDSRIISIRPDSVTVITGTDRDALILDAALSTVRSIKKADPEIMKKVIDTYEKYDLEAYELMSKQAIESLLPVTAPDLHMKSDKPAPEKAEKPFVRIDENINDNVGEKKNSNPPEPSSPSSHKDKGKSKGKSKASDAIEISIMSIKEVIMEIITEQKSLAYDDIPMLLTQKGVSPIMIDWESAVKKMISERVILKTETGTLRRR